jgi:hypothetical protein
MRQTSHYDHLSTPLTPPRKRLLDAHDDLGSWHPVARALRMNVGPVYRFALYGKLPTNPKQRRKLLGRKTINEHLATDRISEMPTDLLAWALLNRVEMK